MQTQAMPMITAPARAVPVRGVQTMTSPGGLAFKPTVLQVGPVVGGRLAYIAAVGPCVGGAGWPGSVVWHSCVPRRLVPGWAQDVLAGLGLPVFGLTDDEAADYVRA